MKKLKKFTPYFIVALALIAISVMVTNTSIESKERKYWFSDMIFDLGTLSDQLDDFSEAVDEQEIHEAIYTLGQIRMMSRNIAFNHSNSDGQSTRDERVVGIIISEIWELSDLEEFEDSILERLQTISIEYMRINDVLGLVNSANNTNEGTFGFLADRIESQLELKYPIDYE